ncbi:hypothetical protein P4S95_10180 [Aneurinibacillus aneurinilyticus]|uniref:hypothetical protein n=1 Tax=Aneurinibacillus aneurinilyticus TaxID=1391 RepID=UPI002E1A7B2A|nr:hypothetical protein [Aneurinibacillus aneurinilyticus]
MKVIEKVLDDQLEKTFKKVENAKSLIEHAKSMKWSEEEFFEAIQAISAARNIHARSESRMVTTCEPRQQKK